MRQYIPTIVPVIKIGQPSGPELVIPAKAPRCHRGRSLLDTGLRRGDGVSWPVVRPDYIWVTTNENPPAADRSPFALS